MNSAKDKEFEFPPCWSDDNRMNSLFAPFRARNVNPTYWDSKMEFWESLIEERCTRRRDALVDLSALNSEFERNEKSPSCLREVLQHLHRNGVLVDEDRFRRLTETSWRTWLVQTVLSSPVRWTMNKVKSTLAGSDDVLTQSLIHLPVVRKLAQELVESIPEESKDKLLTLTHVQEMSKIKRAETMELILHWLCSQGAIAVHDNNQSKLVKFSKNQGSSPAITTADKALFSLEQNRRMLEERLSKMEAERESLLRDTKQHIAVKNMSMAKSTLKRKKVIESFMTKLTDAVGNIETVMYQIRMAEMDSVLLESYQTGISALKGLFREKGLTKDKAEMVRGELEDVILSQRDADAALSQTMASDEFDAAELEDELNKLLESEGEDKGSGKPETEELSLPEVPKSSPRPSKDEEKLEKRLAALAI